MSDGGVVANIGGILVCTMLHTCWPSYSFFVMIWSSLCLELFLLRQSAAVRTVFELRMHARLVVGKNTK